MVLVPLISSQSLLKHVRNKWWKGGFKYCMKYKISIYCLELFKLHQRDRSSYSTILWTPAQKETTTVRNDIHEALWVIRVNKGYP